MDGWIDDRAEGEGEGGDISMMEVGEERAGCGGDVCRRFICEVDGRVMVLDGMWFDKIR